MEHMIPEGSGAEKYGMSLELMQLNWGSGFCDDGNLWQHINAPSHLNTPVEKSFIKQRRKPGVGQSVVHWDPGGVLVGFTYELCSGIL